MTKMISGFISGPTVCLNDIFKICSQVRSRNGSLHNIPEWVFRSWVRREQKSYGNMLALVGDMYGPNGAPGFHVQSCPGGLAIIPTECGNIDVRNATKTIHEAFKAYSSTEAQAVISYIADDIPAQGDIHNMTAAHITLDRVAIMSSVQWINSQRAHSHSDSDKMCHPVVKTISAIVGKIGEQEPFRCINAVRSLTDNAVIAVESMHALANEEQALAEATAGVEAARRVHAEAEARVNNTIALWKE